MPNILEVEKLNVSVGGCHLVRDVSFALRAGDSLGILGESGSGKSITCKAVMGLLPPDFTVTGRVGFMGRNLLELEQAERRALRGKEIGFIMQNPMTAFDPLDNIGSQMRETLSSHLKLSQKETADLAAATLERMLIRDPEHVLRLYPHELSGGMLQRVMIGLTLALEPQFIIADEPTTALDVITQCEVMNIFVTMKKRLSTSMIFISHDLGVIAKIADALLVMCAGCAVEQGEMESIFACPQSAHAKYLFSSRLAVMRRFHELAGRMGNE